MSQLLYIGLNGYAGAGKDTVAKMLKVILDREWQSKEQCKEYYFTKYTNPTQSATFNFDNDKNSQVLCIAYADQLKMICSNIFGIPMQRFYMNKSTAWICINDKFQYTELKPEDDHIITADEYYFSTKDYSESDIKYWMSLREVLVYVGTYVLQSSINKSIFVNIVRNKIKDKQYENPNLKYIVVTDNRFNHELDYIRENNGITITITRKSVEQLDNVAEHDLDNQDDYDYIIDNSNSYDELFDTIWSIVHNDLEFSNKIIQLRTRENVDNYLRLFKSTDKYDFYKLCTSYSIQSLYRSSSEISVINPVGGPMICLGEPIEGTVSANNPKGVIPVQIKMCENTGKFIILVEK